MLGLAAAGLLLPRAEAGVTLATLISFNQTNGASPSAGLIQARDGNYYGTTTFGGPANYGTLFQLTAAGTFTNLISFAGTNGAGPRAPLVQGTDGNFYGTTYNGGSNNFGTLFRLATNGTLTTLATLNFVGGSGAYPIGGLVQGLDGYFYGTAALGGTNGYGTVFKLATNGIFSPLVSFSNTNGSSPYAGLALANDGSLYGTTYLGGTNGNGTIFKLATNGAFIPLYSFTGASDGGNPYAGLIQGADGNFYGTTFNGGAYGNGTVFRLATNGLFTTLVSFGNTNGAHPQASLTQDTGGNFYGTTSSGGAYTNLVGLGYGTVFKLDTNGTLTTLVSFNGTNGDSPQAGLLQVADGSFRGTTAHGGTNGYGTVFRLSLSVPPPPRFLAVDAAGATLTLTWSATVGQVYQMLYKTNLDQAVWNNLNIPINANTPIMTTTDAIGPDPQRFYRILLTP
jgi:uncharacterized repeat protein (TIGR03803 family)